MNNSQIYAAITEKIIANLETAGSWMKLWQVPSPVTMNGHYYRGINRLALSSDPYKSRVYGTFQQIRSNGGQVRKGEKSTIVVFWKTGMEQEDIYWPNGKHAGHLKCDEADYRNSLASVEDEERYTSQYW
jgi:antirestriction protein ArdC